jgi:hypothetical protein
VTVETQRTPTIGKRAMSRILTGAEMMEPSTQKADGRHFGTVSVVVALPILPGKEEEWRRFAQELEDTHAREYEDLRDRLGVRAGSVSLARMFRGEMALVRAEIENPEEILGTLRASEGPFDAFFKEKVLELHGYDLEGSASRRCTEVIFSCSCEEQAPAARGDRGEGTADREIAYEKGVADVE